MQITGIIFVAIVGLLIAFSAISSSDDTESQNTNIPIHKMGELIVHQETSDDSITIKVNKATIVIDEKTPQTCFAGYCTDDRKPGKYIIRVNFEITNLSTDVYVHSKMNMKIEEKDGKRFGPASRSLGLSISELGKGKSLTDSIVYDVDVPLSEYLFVVEPMAFLGGQETKNCIK